MTTATDFYIIRSTNIPQYIVNGNGQLGVWIHNKSGPAKFQERDDNISEIIA